MTRRPSISDKEVTNTRQLWLDRRHPGAPGGSRDGAGDEGPVVPTEGTPALTAPKNLQMREEDEKRIRLADGSIKVQAVVEFDAVVGATGYDVDVMRV
jgi:hypothetical protein